MFFNAFPSTHGKTATAGYGLKKEKKKERQVFPYRGNSGGVVSLPLAKYFLNFPPPEKISSPVDSLHQILPPSTKGFFTLLNNNFHCSCTIFILTSYSLYAQVILILILIDVPYLHNVIFSFEKRMNDQNRTSTNTYRIPTFFIPLALKNISKNLGRNNL